MTEQIQELYLLLHNHFNGDDSKVNLWLTTPNPLLGDIIPMDMIWNGRVDKLLKVVHNMLDGNFP